MKGNMNMQVNSVQSSPNFGMAMRIKNPQRTAEKLKELPIEVIKMIDEAGMKLKDTEFYHIELDELLQPRLVSKPGAYWGPSKGRYNISSIKDTDILMFNNGFEDKYGVSRHYGGEVKDGFVRYGTWDFLGPLSNIRDINALAEVAIDLDKAAVSQAKKIAQQQCEQAAAKKEVESAVDSLISKFSVNA